MKANRIVVLAIAVLALIAVTSSRALPQTFTTIDYPGATHTRLFSINPEGTMVGIYVIGTMFHGILVTPDGINTIDFPGSAVTAALSINPAGDAVGWYAEQTSLLKRVAGEPLAPDI